jgi:hydrogenase maturation protease
MIRIAQHGALVIGLGNVDRGDDAVGAAVVRAVAARLPDVTVVVHEDPTGLFDAWRDHTPVVVVDAVVSGAPAGTMHWLETGPAAARIALDAWAHSGHDSSHAVGLPEMVELGRALGRLPERLVVVGVEAVGFDHGAPLTPAVADAVPVVVDRVCAALTARVEEVPRVPR